jgi:hypothetical protein
MLRNRTRFRLVIFHEALEELTASRSHDVAPLYFLRRITVPISGLLRVHWPQIRGRVWSSRVGKGVRGIRTFEIEEQEPEDGPCPGHGARVGSTEKLGKGEKRSVRASDSTLKVYSDGVMVAEVNMRQYLHLSHWKV